MYSRVEGDLRQEWVKDASIKHKYNAEVIYSMLLALMAKDKNLIISYPIPIIGTSSIGRRNNNNNGNNSNNFNNNNNNSNSIPNTNSTNPKTFSNPKNFKNSSFSQYQATCKYVQEMIELKSHLIFNLPLVKIDCDEIKSLESLGSAISIKTLEPIIPSASQQPLRSAPSQDTSTIRSSIGLMLRAGSSSINAGRLDENEVEDFDDESSENLKDNKDLNNSSPFQNHQRRPSTHTNASFNTKKSFPMKHKRANSITVPTVNNNNNNVPTKVKPFISSLVEDLPGKKVTHKQQSVILVQPSNQSIKSFSASTSKPNNLSKKNIFASRQSNSNNFKRNDSLIQQSQLQQQQQQLQQQQQQQQQQSQNILIRSTSIPAAAPIQQRYIKRIPNIILLLNFQSSTSRIQNAILEIMIRKRVFDPETDTYIPLPTPCMFIGLCESGFEAAINKDLMDRFFISHFLANGPRLKDLESIYPIFFTANNSSNVNINPNKSNSNNNNHNNNTESLNSITSKEPFSNHFTGVELESMSDQVSIVEMEISVRRYQRDLITSLRQNPSFTPFLSPIFSVDFETACKCLAVIQSKHYVTLEIITTILVKVLQHRCSKLQIAPKETGKDFITLLAEYLSHQMVTKKRILSSPS